MRRLALAAIRAYQRYISPYKGFRCAYSVHTGGASCSAFGYRVVRRYGVVAGLTLLRRRTQHCAQVHRRCSPTNLPRPLRSQRGECDLGCAAPDGCGCDLPDAPQWARVYDCASACDCGGCDWPSRGRTKNGEDKYVAIRPKVRSRVEPRSKER